MSNEIQIGWKILKKGMYSERNNFKWRKGQWYKHEGEIKLCESGFHASKELVSAMSYLTPGIIAKVEYRGEVLTGYDKFVASEMRVVETYRFTKRVALEWSIYCARQCYKEWVKYNKSDKRVLKAIQAAENYLNSPSKNNKSAAWSAESAAWSAAESAKSAARSAARSARSAAWSAAWSAAESAVWSAAESAAESARSAAESAAESAAWSAAESAVWSARSAAESARSAAESAAKIKLHKKLLKIIVEFKDNCLI